MLTLRYKPGLQTAARPDENMALGIGSGSACKPCLKGVSTFQPHILHQDSMSVVSIASTDACAAVIEDEVTIRSFGAAGEVGTDPKA